MALRAAELQVEMPSASRPVALDMVAAQAALSCPPGCVAVAMDPPRESIGVILLTDYGAGTMRPEGGTIIGVGPRLDSCGEQLEPLYFVGDRVVVRPYRGLWYEFEGHPTFNWYEVRFYGVDHSPSDCLLLRWDIDKQFWMPLGDWVLLDRDMAESKDGVLLTELGAREHRTTAKVVAGGPFSSVERGQRILIDPDPNAALHLRFSEELAGLQLIREVEHGGARQIWAVIE